MSYVRGAENLRRQATVYAGLFQEGFVGKLDSDICYDSYEKEQDYEMAFVLLTRSAK
jgi:hypothetical protein